MIIEKWIEQPGFSDKETLSYLDANELLELYQEVKLAAKDLFDL